MEQRSYLGKTKISFTLPEQDLKKNAKNQQIHENSAKYIESTIMFHALCEFNCKRR